MAFAHGHSYTANPLACAAAIASLKLLKQLDTQNAIKSIHESHKKGMSILKSSCSNIEHTRILGTISAFDIKNDSNLITKLKKRFLEEGLLIRPLGNTIYLLPPYSITSEELEITYQKIKNVLI
jgi:adenosylmethionine-8-amino-7-oxononanoate aminotransferase